MKYIIRNIVSLSGVKLVCLLSVLIMSLPLQAESYKQVNQYKAVRQELDNLLKNRSQYDDIKQNHIAALKLLLESESETDRKYRLCLKLYEEYMKCQVDSAVSYIRRALVFAEQCGDVEQISLTKLNMAHAYSMSGDYLCAISILDKFDVSAPSITPSLRIAYYNVMRKHCSYYGNSMGQEHYFEQSRIYGDSLLLALNPHSMEYAVVNAEMIVDSDSLPAYINYIYDEWTVDRRQRAFLNYLMGRHYKLRGDTDLAAYYFTLSAIDDVRNGTRDCSSLYNLAIICLNKGALDDAYRYARAVIDDANVLNAHLRKKTSAAGFAIINQAYTDMQALQNRRLKILVCAICLLLLCLSITLFYIYRQVRIASRIKAELAEANMRLTSLNNALTLSNRNLSDANDLKEKYIAHFFDTCSGYIDKLDMYQKRLDILVKQRDMDSLYKLIKATSFVDQEVERLYKSFDEIFLHIYPTFVDDFNLLLPESERIVPKEKELLTTELRIFALIRLGITDTTRIASFLRYSTRTVYNYRSRIRGKAVVDNNRFEECVCRIGASS